MPSPRYLTEGYSRCREVLGITETELAAVVAVMSAATAGEPPPTQAEVCKRIGTTTQSVPFGRLVARRWLVVAFRDPGKNGQHRYAAHDRVWRELGEQRPKVQEATGT